MLAGKRSSMCQHDVRSLIEEATIFFDSRLTFEIEVESHMDTALTEMAIDRSVVPVGLHGCIQITQIPAELIHWHRGILPAFPAERLARNKNGCAQSRFPHVPDAAGFLPGIKPNLRWRCIFLTAINHCLGFFECLLAGLSAKLHQQMTTSFGQQRKIVSRKVFPLHKVDE